MAKFSSRKSQAFSLIELSIVVLIIGILIAGVTQGSRLVRLSKLKTAQNQTQNSPVSGINNLVGWWESTLDSSFKDAEADDGVQITLWNDNNPQAATKNNATTAGTTSTYKANGINGLPVVNFTGAASQGFTLSDTTIINGSDYTIFAVEKRGSTSRALNYFLCGTATPSTTSTLVNVAMGYSTTASSDLVWSYVMPNVSATNYLTGVSVTADTSPRIHTYWHRFSGSTNKKYYLNGATQTLTYINANSLISWSGAAVGCNIGAALGNYLGDIGEIIIYNRSLTNEERRAVEAYLSKKWAITVTVS
jgi:prepilin-type N-terminal cleavage/methylation domain-containing protein